MSLTNFTVAKSWERAERSYRDKCDSQLMVVYATESLKQRRDRLSHFNIRKKQDPFITTEFSMKEYCGQPDFTHTVGRLVGWSVGRLVGWSVGRLVGWSVGRLVGWLVGPSAVNILIREVRV